MVFDSGSDFELITAAGVLPLYNSNGTDLTFDARSQNKGPEPEGITVGAVGDEWWAFIGLERTGGVMAYDITDPLHPHFRTYFNTGEISPEGLDFVPASESPTGLPLLYVGYEVSGQVAVYQIAVPEGQVSRTLGVMLALTGMIYARRRLLRRG